jgi:hypothetical protein
MQFNVTHRYTILQEREKNWQIINSPIPSMLWFQLTDSCSVAVLQCCSSFRLFHCYYLYSPSFHLVTVSIFIQIGYWNSFLICHRMRCTNLLCNKSLKNVTFVRKCKEKQFFCGCSILAEDVVLIQRYSNEESRFDELCGLRHIGVSWEIYILVWKIEINLISYQGWK